MTNGLTIKKIGKNVGKIMFKLEYDKITWALLITLASCLIIDVVFKDYDITTWAFTAAFITIGLFSQRNV